MVDLIEFLGSLKWRSLLVMAGAQPSTAEELNQINSLSLIDWFVFLAFIVFLCCNAQRRPACPLNSSLFN